MQLLCEARHKAAYKVPDEYCSWSRISNAHERKLSARTRHTHRASCVQAVKMDRRHCAHLQRVVRRIKCALAIRAKREEEYAQQIAHGSLHSTVDAFAAQRREYKVDQSIQPAQMPWVCLLPSAHKM